MTTDIAFWNHIADKYASRPVDDPAAFERKIALALAKIKPNDKVLDIGCGTGSLALRLAESGAQVHGLDYSAAMIDIAKAKAAAQRADTVTFHLGAFDERFTVFGPASLDVVYAGSLLHLVADRPAVLRQIFRVLKPGGTFFSSTVCLGESWVPYTPLLRVMRWLGKAPSVQTLTRATLRGELAQAGFVDLDEPDVGAAATIAFVVATRP
jgi:ubiquinone/menaquinone biosynthesis C-methylase UbiE